ncbi:MAG TPA: hypothetical protein VER76_07425 [Pyrinomonadaceae bacterium]|nr:hypothetical protein [Pyrinomonadaceae bacterium]
MVGSFTGACFGISAAARLGEVCAALRVRRAFAPRLFARRFFPDFSARFDAVRDAASTVVAAENMRVPAEAASNDRPNNRKNVKRRRRRAGRDEGETVKLLFFTTTSSDGKGERMESNDAHAWKVGTGATGRRSSAAASKIKDER